MPDTLELNIKAKAPVVEEEEYKLGQRFKMNNGFEAFLCRTGVYTAHMIMCSPASFVGVAYSYTTMEVNEALKVTKKAFIEACGTLWVKV